MMLTSSSNKEKKKVSSSNKHIRSSTVETTTRNSKAEFKKTELIQLLTRFEAELQAKDIALAAFKAEKERLLLFHAQFGRLNRQTDPYAALFRDGEYIKDDILSKQIPMRNACETQLVQIIVRQKNQVETLKTALEVAEKRCLLLIQKLEKEKKDKIRLQAFQNHLLVAEEEKSQLQNDLNNIKLHNKELEEQLIQIMKLLEHEHERHKKFVILFLNERKLENEDHKEQLKQLSNHHINDETQREAKFKELELENERNKRVLTERITQLQSEIDLLVKEKKQQRTHSNSLSSNEEVNEPVSKPKSKTRQLTSTDSSSATKITSQTNELSSTLNTEKSSTSATIPTKNDVHCPTIIPTSSLSKNNGNLLTKARVTSTSTRTQQSISMANSTSSVPPVAKRNFISTRSLPSNSQTSVSSISTISSTTKTNVNRSAVLPRSTKTVHQIVKSTTSADSRKRTNQTSFSSEIKTDDIRTLLETIHAVAENRLKSQTAVVDSSISTNISDLKPTSSSLNYDPILFRTSEIGDADQLLKFLKLGCNPNSHMIDGNTCLHISASNGHIECIRYLLQFDANPYLENNLGITSWNNLSQLDEIIELECLHEFIDHGQNLPPVDLIFNAIERNHTDTYDYLLSILHEQIKNDSSSLSRLLRTALRSSNTYFLECLFTIITVQDFIQLIDSNTFISRECLTVLSSLENEEVHPKSIDLTICISSSNHEHHFSYAIGVISITENMSWLELERSCSKIFIDHITQLDSPFDYEKSSTGCSTNNIDTLTLGPTKWYYQDSPNDDSSPMPYTVAQEQHTIIIHLKGIDINSTDSLAYNYFIPSQNLKTFIRYIEQHMYVGVYGPPYLQKKSLFEDLLRYLERPMAFSTNRKFRVIKFEFESVTSLDDCIDELIEQDFLRTNQLQTNNLEQNHSTKVLLYFANIQNSNGSDMINLLLNSESVSDTCHKLSYFREDDPNSTSYYFSSNFHIFITLSKRTWSTENELYKKFKWIPFKTDNAPWNGLLKRHLWRRMIDTNIRENRSIDHELIKTLQWVTNISQRYNECLQKLSLQDASLGPALFFDCPMEREAIFEWLQTKWNTIIAPFVREFSMNKCIQSKSKDSTAIASSLRANNVEINAPYEPVACRALYVLLQRAVSRDCPLMGYEQEQYLLDFVGSRVEGSSGSMMSSATSSRAGTPQPSGNNDFMSIQLE